MTTRKSARFKVPINLFIDNVLCPIADLSLTGVGVTFTAPIPEIGSEITITMVFPHKTGQEGWEVRATVARFDERKKTLGLLFAEDEEFKAFLLEFLGHMRDEGLI
ncbi:PilZ domain-containing protein [Alphaproteobacteria bacterium]|nr:PilZ domain-containing protein [Alphaproteobacteria bacterium]